MRMCSYKWPLISSFIYTLNSYSMQQYTEQYSLVIFLRRCLSITYFKYWLYTWPMLLLTEHICHFQSQLKMVWQSKYLSHVLFKLTLTVQQSLYCSALRLLLILCPPIMTPGHCTVTSKAKKQIQNLLNYKKYHQLQM